MPYFTTEKVKNSRPVARISGGKNNNEIIYLVMDEEYDNKKLNLKYLGHMEDEIKQLLSGKRKEINISDKGKMVPLPNFETRDTFYLAGPSGSGKSFLASMIINEYQKVFKNNPFYILSKIEDDKALDKLKPIRIELNEELIEDPIQPEEFTDSIVLFDDIDTISNTKMLKQLQQLKDSLLECGRHYNAYVLTTAHNMTNNKATKMSLLESYNVCFFPKMGDEYHIRRYLKEYAGLNKEQIEKIYNLPSRWILHHKRAPNYILHEKGIYLI